MNTSVCETESIPEHVDPLADVFGSAPSSPTLLPKNPSSISQRQSPDQHPQPHLHSTHHHNADPSDIPRLRSKHVTNGYREGIAAGKESSLQSGFDEGYALGGELGVRAGRLMGILEGLLAAVRKSAAQRSQRQDPRPQSVEGNSQRESAPSSRRENEVNTKTERELVALLQTAERELHASSLFAPEFFDADGVWVYDVPDSAGGEEGGVITFREVAAAHPALMKWEGEVREAARKCGVRLARESAEQLP